VVVGAPWSFVDRFPVAPSLVGSEELWSWLGARWSWWGEPWWWYQFHAGFRVDRPAVDEHLREAEDRRERCSELVGDASDELVLHPVELLLGTQSSFHDQSGLLHLPFGDPPGQEERGDRNQESDEELCGGRYSPSHGLGVLDASLHQRLTLQEICLEGFEGGLEVELVGVGGGLDRIGFEEVDHALSRTDEPRQAESDHFVARRTEQRYRRIGGDRLTGGSGFLECAIGRLFRSNAELFVDPEQHRLGTRRLSEAGTANIELVQCSYANGESAGRARSLGGAVECAGPRPVVHTYVIGRTTRIGKD
jgi:hypothetical protein